MSRYRKINTVELQASSSVDAWSEALKYGPPGPWPGGWGSWENVRLAHVRLMRELMDSVPPYPEGRYEGDGIVMGVTAKPGSTSGKFLKNGYLPAAWVAVKELRRHGCQLPIVFAHLGPLEWDPTLTRLVEPLGVEVVDLAKEDETDPMRILAGFECKVYAVVRSRFRRVLYLDADNIPLRDPTYLFGLPHISQYGAVLWPDVPPPDRDEWLPKEVWHNIDMPHLSDVIACESGQILIDKKLWWKELCLCRWMNEHSDWFYQFIFGDKDTFVLSPLRWYWDDPENNACNYFMVPHGAGGPGASLVHYDPARRPLFQHCTRNKCTVDGYPDRNTILVRDYADAHLAELRDLWHGRLWHNATPGEEELAVMGDLGRRRWRYERLQEDGSVLDGRVMSFLGENRIGRGLAACETDWNVFADQEGPLLVIGDIHGAPTCLLRRSEDGCWRGRWLQHERCPVILSPE